MGALRDCIDFCGNLLSYVNTRPAFILRSVSLKIRRKTIFIEWHESFIRNRWPAIYRMTIRREHFDTDNSSQNILFYWKSWMLDQSTTHTDSNCKNRIWYIARLFV